MVDRRLDARRTLDDAFYYARTARIAADAGSSDDVRRHLQTVVQVTRSVTFHLQKQCKHMPGFESWYETQQQHLGSDQLAKWFVTVRNVVVKERPLALRRKVHLLIRDSITVRDHIVVRGPGDREEAPIPPHTSQGGGGTTATAADVYYFDDPDWAEYPALDLVDQYLALLDQVVSAAESLFCHDPLSS